MAFDLKNKVVFITGAAAGIGSGVVRILLEEGVKHVAIIDIDEKGTALQNELNKKYGPNKVKFFKCDVTDEVNLFAAFKSVTEDQGYIDVVINNAAIMNDSMDVYKKQIEVNLTALVSSSLKALELMRKDEGGKGGTIINISSVAAIVRSPIMPIYYATKSAVLQFSNCLGLEEYYAITGVRVITVCFGATDTPLLSRAKMGTFDKKMDDLLEDRLDTFPWQRMESAAQGVVDVYKQAKSGSTWIATSNKPAKDISSSIANAYDNMAVHVFDKIN